MTLYNAVRGTKDVLPAETGKWQYVISQSASVFKTFNYAEIITPIFEVTELFTRGIGETSDIVTKEMYTFPDKKGRSLTLRPEGTAGVVRAYLENKLFNGPSPVKLFYIGPMFRYERPQAGRYREHWQMGVEVFGSDSPALDAEVINTGLTLFSKLGVTGLKTNLNSIGCLNDNCRPAYIKALKTYLENSKEKLCETCKFRLEKNPLRILDCKEESCRSIFKEQGIPRILNFICPSCKEHFDKVKAHLGLLGAEYVLNENLVRGLDYYTKTVFEITCDKLGAQNTVLGGGRYNNLVKEFGGQETPAVGFSTGLERLMITLDTLGIKLPVNDSADVFLVHLGEEALKKVFVLADTLRKTGLKV
ncbi:MAG: histidine--tRNA ligase, partial [Candidatus Firestonebacteria bacterium]